MAKERSIAIMNFSIVGLFLLMAAVQSSGAPQKPVELPAATTPTTKAQQEVISLSKEKWQDVRAEHRRFVCSLP
jgi:hypothetical protein